MDKDTMDKFKDGFAKVVEVTKIALDKNDEDTLKEMGIHLQAMLRVIDLELYKDKISQDAGCRKGKS